MSNERAWFYGYGGYFGEPDCTEPEEFRTPEDASAALGANYEIAGPFSSEQEAQAHQEAWLEQCG